MVATGPPAYNVHLGREGDEMGALPLFPTTVVGSWPRPDYLLDALKRRQAGRISFEEFNQVADKAVLEALKYQDEAGIDIVSDGEQRRDNFYSFVTEKLEGVKLMTLAELIDIVEDKRHFEAILKQLDVPAFSIKNATVVDKLSRKRPIALDEYEFLREHTDKPIKVPLPGPYILTRSMWVQGVTDKVYPSQDALAQDIVKVLREEVAELKAAGCQYIQFDEPVLTEAAFRRDTKERTFMCASMGGSSGDVAKELLWASRLMNQVVGDVDGVNLGMHVCRGNWSRKEETLLEGAYDPLMPYMMIMKLDQLVLEFATPRSGSLGVFEQYKNQRELGLGVVNPRTDELESPDFVVQKTKEALDYFKPEQIYLNPDCGFGTFAERPMNPADKSFAKLQVMVEGAQRLRKEHGG
jgi:5-methyltetrahydropteroyltriglutamate--homocysteine methyltransferase